MTSHNDQIRALIAEIDQLLGSSPGLLWGLSGERSRHRAALEHLRTYLLTLQSSLRKARIRQLPAADSPTGEEGRLWGAVTAESAADDAPLGGPVMATTVVQEENPAQSLLNQLGQDIDQLRLSLLAPLQDEVNQLQVQRQALRQEVQHLEQQRQSAIASAGSEKLLQDFMEQLMVRLQERLVTQVAQALQQTVAPLLAGPANAALPGADRQQIEQIQGRANALLGNLDSTLQVFSKTLEQNVQGYQQSLTQGLERMHNLGQQGELMVAHLVDRLAHQVEARTLVYLQAPEPGQPPLPGAADPLRLQPQSAFAASASAAIAHDIAHNPFRAGWAGPEEVGTNDWDSSVGDRSLAPDPVAPAADGSTSSAGIARRRVMAAQASDRRAQQARQEEFAEDSGLSGLNWSNPTLEQSRAVASGRPSALPRLAGSLEDFYASIQAEGRVGQSGDPELGDLGLDSTPTLARSVGGEAGYQSLEDALFDGIPEGAALGSQRRVDDLLPERSIERLTDLVDRRFDDFATPESALAEALYGDPSRWSRTATPGSAQKKNVFLRQIPPAQFA